MTLTKTLLAAALGLSSLAATTISASAYIACSGKTCWHVSERHNYPRDARIVIHEDNWRLGRGYRFREHEGRGYWRGSRWLDIR